MHKLQLEATRHLSVMERAARYRFCFFPPSKYWAPAFPSVKRLCCRWQIKTELTSQSLCIWEMKGQENTVIQENNERKGRENQRLSLTSLIKRKNRLSYRGDIQHISRRKRGFEKPIWRKIYRIPQTCKNCSVLLCLWHEIGHNSS